MHRRKPRVQEKGGGGVNDKIQCVEEQVEKDNRLNGTALYAPIQCPEANVLNSTKINMNH